MHAPPIRVSHHLLLCATPTKALCCPDPSLGAASWDTLKRLVREWGLENPARPEGVVLRNKADCLRICGEGPVLLIWPEGIVYGGVTPERIERILREHVMEGTPVEAWMLRRYSLSDPVDGVDTADVLAMMTPNQRPLLDSDPPAKL
jgi:(2Fe-2S) ferredoxin